MYFCITPFGHKLRISGEEQVLVSEVFAARLILGCVFLVSSWGKFLSFPSLTSEVLDYRLLPEKQSRVVAYSLPFVELALAVFIIVGFGLLPVSLLILFLLATFTSAIAINLIQGRRFECHCFGSNSAMIGPTTLVRNALLMGLAFWLLLHSSLTLSFNSFSNLWKDDIRQITDANSIVPVVGVTIISLIILFLLSKIDAILLGSSSVLDEDEGKGLGTPRVERQLLVIKERNK